MLSNSNAELKSYNKCNNSNNNKCNKNAKYAEHFMLLLTAIAEAPLSRNNSNNNNNIINNNNNTLHGTIL